MHRTTNHARAAALCALALALLAGCPAPTGRHRGDRSDGTAGLCLEDASTISPGGGCTIDLDQCDLQRICGAGGIEVDSCLCEGNTWQCTQGPCGVPDPDGGDPICPSDSVYPGQPCAPRLGGLRCTGVATDCFGDQSMTDCYCTDMVWSCAAGGCDAGAPDSGGCADLPDPGGACVPGTRCEYPGLACLSACTCRDSGEFQCDPPCAEAGVDGAPSEAGDAGTGDASRDAALDGGLTDARPGIEI